MDKNWHSWLNDNLSNGCNPAEVFDIMLKRGFSKPEILNGIQDHHLFADYPKPGETIQDSAGNSAYYERLAKTSITQSQGQRLEDERLQLYIWNEFLTVDECDALIEHINPILYPSTVTVSNGDDAFRTSRTSDLMGSSGPFIARIDRKIADTLGIALEYSEPMQAQRYDEGNEFKAHTDYFNPGSKEFELFAEEHGQRTWTFMIYLNETERGGGTRFTNLGTTFYPKKGQALIWNNLYPDGSVNPDSIHHGMPVEKGEKIIITKWFRDKPSRKLWPE